MRFLLLLAAAAASLIILTVVGLATGSAIAGFLTATVALVLFVLVRWLGLSSLLESIRNSNWLDERPVLEDRERKAKPGPRE